MLVLLSWPTPQILVKTAFIVPERQLFLPSLGYAVLAALAITWTATALAFHPPQLCPPPSDGDDSSAAAGQRRCVCTLLWRCGVWSRLRLTGVCAMCVVSRCRLPRASHAETRRLARLLAVLWSLVWIAV